VGITLQSHRIHARPTETRNKYLSIAVLPKPGGLRSFQGVGEHDVRYAAVAQPSVVCRVPSAECGMNCPHTLLRRRLNRLHSLVEANIPCLCQLLGPNRLGTLVRLDGFDSPVLGLPSNSYRPLKCRPKVVGPRLNLRECVQCREYTLAFGLSRYIAQIAIRIQHSSLLTCKLVC
jgi:hypothetical protein